MSDQAPDKTTIRGNRNKAVSLATCTTARFLEEQEADARTKGRADLANQLVYFAVAAALRKVLHLHAGTCRACLKAEAQQRRAA